MDLKTLLLRHRDRYPKMEIEDYVKLLYQQTFGPRHLYGQPDMTTIDSYLNEELKKAIYYHQTPMKETIGAGYCRVSLNAVNQGDIQDKQLVRLFFISMQTSPPFNADNQQAFKEKLEVLLTLIEKQTILLDYQNSRSFIEQYLEAGIKPLHHSMAFKTHYHPHYRVIDETLIKDIL